MNGEKHARVSAALSCAAGVLLLGAGATDAQSSAASKTPAVSLSGPHNYRAGRSPASVGVADLNGDRRLDLAVAHGRNTVSVLLNRGHARFPAKREYRVGRDPYSIAIGDVNSDHRLDLAVANSSDYTVSVLLNLGGGAFGSRHDYATAPGTFGVVIRDLNGDGKPDLATANAGDDNVQPTLSVLFGSGDGRFGTHIDYPNPEQGLTVASADLNGDGRADVVVAGVSVFLNSEDGLQPPRSYAAGGDAVAIADMNGDRKPGPRHRWRVRAAQPGRWELQAEPFFRRWVCAGRCGG